MSTTTAKSAVVPAAASDAHLKAAVIQAASPVVQALAECNEELREEAVQLFKQLNSGSLDQDERQATLSLLTEILFPLAGPSAPAGQELQELEDAERDADAEAREALAGLDQEEDAFAERLRVCMENRRITQEQLARKLGVGQPAISMMLQRHCRPQKRTVQRLAAALGMAPEDLWQVK